MFFFLDRYAMGGAQRVHLDIIESVDDIQKKVFFTRRSADDLFKSNFYDRPRTENKDIHLFCDYLFFRLFSVHYFAFYINRHARATVFSSNSTFFYDLLPFLRSNVFTIDLLHNFTYGKKGMEFFGLANHRYLSRRMVIDAATKEQIRAQYMEYGISPSYYERVQLAEFGVALPETLSKDLSLPVKVLYAGRGGPQKRVWLISRIAEFFIDHKEPVEFHFAGTMQADLSEKVKHHEIVHGEISDKKEMNRLYQDCHMLILTSAYEGFPMVIKEAMAYGCIPVVTALKGNKTHLRNLFNALLIDEIEDESKVVTEAVGHIRTLMNDPALTAELSENAYRYAKANFTRSAFLSTYRTLLAGESK